MGLSNVLAFLIRVDKSCLQAVYMRKYMYEYKLHNLVECRNDGVRVESRYIFRITRSEASRFIGRLCIDYSHPCAEAL